MKHIILLFACFCIAFSVNVFAQNVAGSVEIGVYSAYQIGNFDGALNIKMRLGLPPLGIIGIPMKITGTKDDPKVSLGRENADLKEVEYEEGQVPTSDEQDPITK